MQRWWLYGGALLITTAIVGGASASAASPERSPAVNLEASWRASIARRAVADPAARFSNPANAKLAAGIRRAAARYHFKIVRFEVLHPKGTAPLLVVQTANKVAMAAATPAILRSIDPKRRTNADRTGWAYEGFFFEARDRNGVPFLVVRNFWRGEHVGGGQWASQPTLYPFDHG